MFTLVITWWILLHHVKIYQTLQLLQSHKWRHPFHVQIWFKYSLPPTMATNKTSPTRCEDHKRGLNWTFAWTMETLSCDIFTINVLYFIVTHFKSSNMLIHQVFTFCKIFNPPIFTISTSLVNSKCHLGELEK
jgi:hypothetical protein